MANDDIAKARLLRARAESRELWVPISGTSMGRRYASATQVLVAAMDRSPRIGEIWVFCLHDATVAHRFLRRRGSHLVFAGDAMPRTDAPVHSEQLVGRVTLVDDRGRRWRPSARHAVAPLARDFYRAAARRLFKRRTSR